MQEEAGGIGIVFTYPIERQKLQACPACEKLPKL